MHVSIELSLQTGKLSVFDSSYCSVWYEFDRFQLFNLLVEISQKDRLREGELREWEHEVKSQKKLSVIDSSYYGSV